MAVEAAETVVMADVLDGADVTADADLGVVRVVGATA